MQIHKVLYNACKHLKQDVYIIDTKGNFLLCSYHCSYVNDTDEFFAEMSKLTEHQNFILIVDCITFMLDKKNRTDYLKRFFNLSWDLIYENNATIIVVNHYYQYKTRDGIEDLPRLGRFWKNLIDNRLCIVWEKGEMILKDVEST